MMRTSILNNPCGVAVRRNGFGRLSRLLSSASASSSSSVTTRAASVATTSSLQQQQQQQQQHGRRSHYTFSSPGQFNAPHPHSHDHDGNHHHDTSYAASHDALLQSIWKDRDFSRRGFTVGIGGPVGSGKTALVLQLCLTLGGSTDTTATATDTSTSTQFVPSLAVVTNDIFTQEDAEYLVRNKALADNRIRAVETGGCPHAAIREDVSANLAALEDLTRVLASEHDSDTDTSSTRPLLLCESGGDNLAANFSPELADLTLYVIDVAGGDKVPRKGGPGITQSDLLIVNKVDLAEAVGADLRVMRSDADRMRGNGQGPTVFAAVKHGTGMEEIRAFILSHYQKAMELSESTKKTETK